MRQQTETESQRQLFTFHSELLIYARIEFHEKCWSDGKMWKIIRHVSAKYLTFVELDNWSDRCNEGRMEFLEYLYQCRCFVGNAASFVTHFFSVTVV